jgi:hypothetical protein
MTQIPPPIGAHMSGQLLPLSRPHIREQMHRITVTPASRLRVTGRKRMPPGRVRAMGPPGSYPQLLCLPLGLSHPEIVRSQCGASSSATRHQQRPVRYEAYLACSHHPGEAEERRELRPLGQHAGEQEAVGTCG